MTTKNQSTITEIIFQNKLMDVEDGQMHRQKGRQTDLEKKKYFFRSVDRFRQRF